MTIFLDRLLLDRLCLLLLEHHQLLLLLEQGLQLLLVELVQELLTENGHLHEVSRLHLVLPQHLLHLSLIRAELILLLHELLPLLAHANRPRDVALDLCALQLFLGERSRSTCCACLPFEGDLLSLA